MLPDPKNRTLKQPQPSIGNVLNKQRQLKSEITDVKNILKTTGTASKDTLKNIEAIVKTISDKSDRESKKKKLKEISAKNKAETSKENRDLVDKMIDKVIEYNSSREAEIRKLTAETGNLVKASSDQAIREIRKLVLSDVKPSKSMSMSNSIELINSNNSTGNSDYEEASLDLEEEHLANEKRFFKKSLLADKMNLLKITSIESKANNVVELLTQLNEHFHESWLEKIAGWMWELLKFAGAGAFGLTKFFSGHLFSAVMGKGLAPVLAKNMAFSMKSLLTGSWISSFGKNFAKAILTGFGLSTLGNFGNGGPGVNTGAAAGAAGAAGTSMATEVAKNFVSQNASTAINAAGKTTAKAFVPKAVRALPKALAKFSKKELGLQTSQAAVAVAEKEAATIAEKEAEEAAKKAAKQAFKKTGDKAATELAYQETKKTVYDAAYKTAYEKTSAEAAKSIEKDLIEKYGLKNFGLKKFLLKSGIGLAKGLNVVGFLDTAKTVQDASWEYMLNNMKLTDYQNNQALAKDTARTFKAGKTNIDLESWQSQSGDTGEGIGADLESVISEQEAIFREKELARRQGTEYLNLVKNIRELHASMAQSNWWALGFGQSRKSIVKELKSKWELLDPDVQKMLKSMHLSPQDVDKIYGAKAASVESDEFKKLSEAGYGADDKRLSFIRDLTAQKANENLTNEELGLTKSEENSSLLEKIKSTLLEMMPNMSMEDIEAKAKAMLDLIPTELLKSKLGMAADATKEEVHKRFAQIFDYLPKDQVAKFMNFGIVATELVKNKTGEIKEKGAELLATGKEKLSQLSTVEGRDAVLAEAKEKGSELLLAGKEKSAELLAAGKEKGSELLDEAKEKGLYALTMGIVKGDMLRYNASIKKDELLDEAKEKGSELLAAGKEKGSELLDEAKAKALYGLAMGANAAEELSYMASIKKDELKGKGAELLDDAKAKALYGLAMGAVKADMLRYNASIKKDELLDEAKEKGSELLDEAKEKSLYALTMGIVKADMLRYNASIKKDELLANNPLAILSSAMTSGSAQGMIDMFTSQITGSLSSVSQLYSSSVDSLLNLSSNMLSQNSLPGLGAMISQTMQPIINNSYTYNTNNGGGAGGVMIKTITDTMGSIASGLFR